MSVTEKPIPTSDLLVYVQTADEKFAGPVPLSELLSGSSSQVAEVGLDGKILVKSSVPTMKRETFVATAGQTAFTLAKTPLGDVLASINGQVIDVAAWTVSGKTLTYGPAGNDSEGLIADQRVDVYYSTLE